MKCAPNIVFSCFLLVFHFYFIEICEYYLDSVIRNDRVLDVGQNLYSPQKGFRLHLESSGNLVIYNSSEQKIW
jgi:hypothetical protein